MKWSLKNFLEKACGKLIGIRYFRQALIYGVRN
jgi:hypothetical protein